MSSGNKPSAEAEDLGAMIGRMRLMEDDDGILPLHEALKQGDHMLGKLCLVGKVLTRRRINFNGFHDALMASWSPKRSIKIFEIGDKLYLFQFSDVTDLNKVLYKALWNFSNSLIILKRFQAFFSSKQYDFSTNPFWVRIFDVPIGLHSEKIGRMIGNSLGKVLEVDAGFRKALRVKVDLEVHKPLKRFKTSQITTTECRKLRLKYERLLEFCFVCGCIGHLENDCEVAFHIKAIGGKVIRRFGSWLKAELENSWCPENIDELDEFFISTTCLLFKEKDKDVKMNSGPNHLLDANIGQHNSIDIELNGGSHVDEGTNEDGVDLVEQEDRLVHGTLEQADNLLEVPLSQEFGFIRGENRSGCGLGYGKWRRLDHNLGNPSSKERTKHGKRKTKTALVEEERALKVLVDNSGVAFTRKSEGHNLSTG